MEGVPRKWRLPLVTVGAAFVGSVVYLLVGLSLDSVPPDPIWLSQLLVFLIVPLFLGAVFSLALLDTGPVSGRWALVVGTAGVPLLLLWGVLTGNPMVLIRSFLGLVVIAAVVYLLPRVARQIGRHVTEGVYERDVAILVVAGLGLAAAGTGVYVYGAHISHDPCESAQSFLAMGPAEGASTGYTRARFAYAWSNGTLEIYHDGGESLDPSRLFVEVGRSSVAWARLSHEPGKVTTGESVTLLSVERGEIVEVVYWVPDPGCEFTLSRNQVGMPH